MSAHQIHRMPGAPCKTAWFMCHPIREAMREMNPAPIGGEGKVIEADETYHGQRETPRKRNKFSPPPARGGKSGGAQKRNIVGLVERGGQVRTFHVLQATAATVRDILVKNVSRKSDLHTDESPIYTAFGTEFAAHNSVVHSKKEYVRGKVHTNTVEGVWAMFKRGMKGIYQHCGEAHFHRCLAEFDSRYNRRSALGVSVTEGAHCAIRGAAGCRLMFQAVGEA